MTDTATPIKDDQFGRKVFERLIHDFNLIPLPLLEKAYPDGQLLDHIIYPDDYLDIVTLPRKK